MNNNPTTEGSDRCWKKSKQSNEIKIGQILKFNKDMENISVKEKSFKNKYIKHMIESLKILKVRQHTNQQNTLVD